MRKNRQFEAIILFANIWSPGQDADVRALFYLQEGFPVEILQLWSDLMSSNQSSMTDAERPNTVDTASFVKVSSSSIRVVCEWASDNTYDRFTAQFTAPCCRYLDPTFSLSHTTSKLCC